MKHFLHQPTRLMAATVLALLALSLAGTPSSAAPLQQGVIHKAHIASVMDTSFAVSWTTDEACTASVNYGTTPALGSTLSDTQNTTTHYVTVGPLTANTTYYFDTVSNGVADNNGGAHYTVTTGPTLTLPGSLTIFGMVYQSDGVTGAGYAIVYLKVTHASIDSQLASVRTFSPSGGWTYNLDNLRTADYQNYFPWATGDTITIMAQGGECGTGQITPLVPAASGSVGNITLNGIPTAVGLASFGAHSSTLNLALPLAAVGLIGSLGLLVRRIWFL
jgi:hypothetical protein